MSIYYSKYDLNTYRSTPYFQHHLPADYPLAEVLQECKAFRRLPPRLKELSRLAKVWAIRNWPSLVEEVSKWYDDLGFELDPDTGDRLTEKEIDSLWSPNLTSFTVVDLPTSIKFSDPDTWVDPTAEVQVESITRVTGPPSAEELRKYVKSHSLKRTAKEYGISEDELLSLIK